MFLLAGFPSLPCYNRPVMQSYLRDVTLEADPDLTREGCPILNGKSGPVCRVEPLASYSRDRVGCWMVILLHPVSLTAHDSSNPHFSLFRGGEAKMHCSRTIQNERDIGLGTARVRDLNNRVAGFQSKHLSDNLTYIRTINGCRNDAVTDGFILCSNGPTAGFDGCEGGNAM